MNNVPKESIKPTGMIKISGQISNYKSTREHANFFFTQNDNKAMSLAAIASAAIGSSGLAMGAAISASDMEEEADYVEFEMDGKAIKGWVWCSPFANKDMVDVVGEWREDYFELVAIARPADRTIALYPHCSRGKRAHIKNAIKWWFLGVTGFMVGIFPIGIMGGYFMNNESGLGVIASLIGMFIPFVLWLFFGKNGLIVSAGLVLTALLSVFDLEEIFKVISIFWGVPVVFYIFMGIFAIHYSWKTMKFVNVATYVFDALGLENPSNIDFPKTSQAEVLKLIKKRKEKKENEAIKESKNKKRKNEKKSNVLLSQSEISFGSMYLKY
ncbi:putative type VI secretion system effector [Janthinobacterium sp. B9-8]|uniref:putative type VI secretion system effector n=1 Tax=Janthinobacterium sp. B9-8 TaxID=1236179 RepID=UPI0007647D96|nr:putative type VI secretion system effector [Janthinobacterium sp. B9-8]AMC34359.1 hypothetical protein VN23_06960 [Janthinobacterium sp. B9-8]